MVLLWLFAFIQPCCASHMPQGTQLDLKPHVPDWLDHQQHLAAVQTLVNVNGGDVPGLEVPRPCSNTNKALILAFPTLGEDVHKSHVSNSSSGVGCWKMYMCIYIYTCVNICMYVVRVCVVYK